MRKRGRGNEERNLEAGLLGKEDTLGLDIFGVGEVCLLRKSI